MRLSLSTCSRAGHGASQPDSQPETSHPIPMKSCANARTKFAMALLAVLPSSFPAPLAGQAAPVEAGLLGWIRKSSGLEIRSVDSREENAAPYNLAFAGDGELEIYQPVDLRRESDAGVTFYEFRFSPAFAPRFGAAASVPASGGRAEKMPTIDIGGAILGYRLSEMKESRSAELVVFLGAGSAKGERRKDEWMTTGVHFEIRDDGRVVGHAPMVVRADAAKGVWDLYLYGELFLVDLPYRERGHSLIVKSASQGGASLRGMSVSDSNPLFVDSNVDGIPDEFAARHGGIARDEPVPGKGSTLLVEYLARANW